PDFLLQVFDRRVELRVLSGERAMGQVVDDDIGVDAVAFDQPVAVRTKDASLRRRGDAAIDEEVARREPDLSSPGPRANHFPEAEPTESFGERLAVRGGVLIANHHDMSAKGVLHVPGRAPDPRLPV